MGYMLPQVFLEVPVYPPFHASVRGMIRPWLRCLLMQELQRGVPNLGGQSTYMKIHPQIIRIGLHEEVNG